MMLQRITALLSVVASVSAGTVLMEASGGLRVQNIPFIPTSEGVVAVISSPGTPSALFSEASDDILSLQSEDPPSLYCRGATLSGTSDRERTSLATCSLVAGAIVVDGITVGDVEAGLRNSRHARTLTALFRARVKLDDMSGKQTLILCLAGDDDAIDTAALASEIKGLYKAASVEKKGAASFNEMYDLQVYGVTSEADAEKVMSRAALAAKTMQRETESLSLALTEAHDKVRDSGVGADALDPPHVASAFVTVGNAYDKQARTARAKISAWRARVSRGLWIDSFGRDAEYLRKRVLGTFDTETLSASGLLLVASYRLEKRKQLQSLVDSALEELFGAQVANLEKSTLKRLQAQLLKTSNDSAEDVIDSNAAALRQVTFSFESVMEDLEVPALGLTKEKAVRAMSSKLNDSLMAFPDSPAAKIKRTKKVDKIVTKEKKPNQRAIDFGVDLVAMLRPDGFGSLQGFAGYQLGGNSVTFGVHNDADDPQTIAQFGGVRPPLLRVQPKLRVDVEL